MYKVNDTVLVIGNTRGLLIPPINSPVHGVIPAGTVATVVKANAYSNYVDITYPGLDKKYEAIVVSTNYIAQIKKDNGLKFEIGDVCYCSKNAPLLSLDAKLVCGGTTYSAGSASTLKVVETPETLAKMVPVPNFCLGYNEYVVEQHIYRHGYVQRCAIHGPWLKLLVSANSDNPFDEIQKLLSDHRDVLTSAITMQIEQTSARAHPNRIVIANKLVERFAKQLQVDITKKLRHK